MATARFLIATIVGLVTMALDFLFHAFLTSPLEIPTYFLMKLGVSFLVALALPEIYEKVGGYAGLVGAFIFTFIVDIYYFVGVLVFQIPGLSVSPTQVIAILGQTNQILLVGEWTFFHGLFFFVGYLLVQELVRES